MGDFNGDGSVDFAVAVISRAKDSHQFIILVFNGPYRKDARPSFSTSGTDVRWRGLFYGPPRPKPYRLLFGRFEADGAIFIPRGATYILKLP